MATAYMALETSGEFAKLDQDSAVRIFFSILFRRAGAMPYLEMQKSTQIGETKFGISE